MKAYFFGVADNGGAGHYLHMSDLVRTHDLPTACPFGYGHLDAGLLPMSRGGGSERTHPEGVVHYACQNGWSLIQFWDRSGDSRPGSNSAFLVDAIKTPDEMIALFRETFPTVCSRFPFELKLAE